VATTLRNPHNQKECRIPAVELVATVDRRSGGRTQQYLLWCREYPRLTTNCYGGTGTVAEAGVDEANTGLPAAGRALIVMVSPVMVQVIGGTDCSSLLYAMRLYVESWDRVG
jgi:hypothetical protein